MCLASFCKEAHITSLPFVSFISMRTYSELDILFSLSESFLKNGSLRQQFRALSYVKNSPRITFKKVLEICIRSLKMHFKSPEIHP